MAKNNKLKRYMRYLFDRGSKKCWNQVVDYLDIQPESVFLDIGCGDGTMTTTVMAEKIQTHKLYGVELEENRALSASKKGVTIYKNDLNKDLPIPSASIDVIVGNQIIEHMINVDNFVKETYRILKPGGYIIIGTENLASWHNIFMLLLGRQPFTGPYVSTQYSLGQHPLLDLKTEFKPGGSMEMAYIKHNTVMAYKTLKKILTAYGFSIVATKGFGYHPWPGAISDLLSSVDTSHSHFIIIKAKKPTKQ